MPRTKIVCAIGPASRSPETLEHLIRAGMDVARLNFSHGTPVEHLEVITAVRHIAERMDRPIAIHRSEHRTFILDDRRTRQQDSELAVKQLVETLRALSVGVIPFTGVSHANRL